MIILKSEQDNSANIINDKIECRFVQRSDDYFIIYVSSHTGCNQSCRFCHLTQTGQTEMKEVTPFQYLEQVNKVLKYWQENHYDKRHLLKRVHINFMARGEPLLNKHLCRDFKEIRSFIDAMVYQTTGVAFTKYKISTIFPKDSIEHLGHYSSIFNSGAEFYYSLYSTDKDFRKQWIPKAHEPFYALSFLENKNLTIHYALIKDKNDSLEDAQKIVNYIKQSSRSNNKPKLNIISYNPYSIIQGEETSEDVAQQYVQYMEDSKVFSRVKLIPRVGFDVKASCGMFVTG